MKVKIVTCYKLYILFFVGHAESYNPPPEYLFDAKELKEWERLKDTPYKRKLHFVPQKYKSLREVPSYSRYMRVSSFI